MNYKTRSLPGKILIIEGLFNDKEMDDIFNSCIKEIRLSHKLPLLFGLVVPLFFDLYPEIEKKVVNKKVKEALADYLEVNIENVIISRHSDYHQNTLGGWHRDLGSDEEYISFQDSQKVKIFKFALIKNMKGNSQNVGTQFKIEGNHLKPLLKNGDVLLFPVNVIHRGYPGNLIVSFMRRVSSKILPERASNYVVNYISRIFDPRGREAIFFTFGLESPLFNKFEEENLKRAKEQFNKYSPEVFNN